MTQYQGLAYNDTVSTTLGGILQDIYFLGKCNASSFPTGDLNRTINKYYGQLQEVVRAVNENFYMIVATSDLYIGDGSYTFPDGTGTAPSYEKIKALYVSLQPADKTNPQVNEFERVNIADPTSINDPSYTFSQPTALMFGTYFVLYPLVTDVTEYPVIGGVKIYYIATQDKLILDTDVPKIFPSFHDAIVQGALIDVATRLGNDKLKQDSVAIFKKRLEEIRSYASSRIPDEIGLLEGNSDTAGGWMYPFGNNVNSM